MKTVNTVIGSEAPLTGRDASANNVGWWGWTEGSHAEGGGQIEMGAPESLGAYSTRASRCFAESSESSYHQISPKRLTLGVFYFYFSEILFEEINTGSKKYATA